MKGSAVRFRPNPCNGLIRASDSRDSGCHHLFAGKLDKSKLGFGERAVMLAFRAVEGDYRDWNEIEAWASGIAHELRPPPPRH